MYSGGSAHDEQQTVAADCVSRCAKKERRSDRETA